MDPVSENTAAPQQPQPEPPSAEPLPAEQQPVRPAWIRPDFEAVDTALEVTAYSGRD